MERKDYAAAALLPLFDSSVSLPQDSASPPRASNNHHPSMFSPPQQQQQQQQPLDDTLHAGLFGQLPASSGGGGMPAAVSVSVTHSRAGSYGTSLLDTLNEGRSLNHHRHLTLSGAAGLLSPAPFAMPDGGGRIAMHARAHTMTAAPAAMAMPAATNASGILGAHARLGPAQASMLASSALRSSYSSNNLRTAFARRSSPSPLAGADAVLDDGVWGPSRLSTELDLLVTPDSNSQPSLADAMGCLAVGHGPAHRRNTGGAGTASGSDPLARMRSYSFTSPPGMANGTDEPDMDVLHAAAKTQNPSLAFRKMMARSTHARSKTLASPFAPTDSAADVHIAGIGGESVSAAHSRQPSTHARQPSADLDSAHGGMGGEGGVPTRSLWVGNVDPRLTSQDLVELFGKYGRVESLRLLPDKECAFVNFLRIEDAVRAREDLHAGARIGSSTVRVGYGKGEAHASGDAQAMQPTRALWIGNIAPSLQPSQLARVFQSFGAIESARVLNHKNCGFVNFTRLEDAVRAKQAMNGKSIEGSVVRIGYAKVPAAKADDALKLRNPVPSAAPLTASGQRAEADAIAGTTQRGLGSLVALEPGVSLAIDEDLVAFPYATRLPQLPATGRGDGDEARPVAGLQQTRLRDLRRQLDTGGVSDDEFGRMVRELLPHAVELCTDYVGNVLVQKIAERGTAAQRLELVQRVGPHMAAVGVHKNGTWAVQKIIDMADALDQRTIIASSLKKYTPQLLLDQLGNYVVQCCLRFGAPPAAGDGSGSNQFIFDAIHARCTEIGQGRFGARAVRTCLESRHADRKQQKLVAVALVTSAPTLATSANGHLLVNWLLDSSRFAGRLRVLAHQVAPHLRYLAMHKLGAATVSKLADQREEPDARDLILNTLFFNPDPTVLEDVVADHAQGLHVVLRVLQGSAIGDAEKARIAERLRPLVGPAGPPPAAATAATAGAGPRRSSGSGPPAQRLADAVAAALARVQPSNSPTPPPQQQQEMPAAHHLPMGAGPPPPLGFHPMPPPGMLGTAAGGPMSYPAPPQPQPLPVGFGGMVTGPLPLTAMPPPDAMAMYHHQHHHPHHPMATPGAFYGMEAPGVLHFSPMPMGNGPYCSMPPPPPPPPPPAKPAVSRGNDIGR
ncbi:hypothetical protein H4R19_000325 [Coemansia spiralis]|nr:hypothetical protein H4R19_000325 [Coemansia spiralis]